MPAEEGCMLVGSASSPPGTSVVVPWELHSNGGLRNGIFFLIKIN